MLPQPPPDVVLLGTEWQPRALIRAQLIEQGFDVVATDTWAKMRRHLRPGATPRFAIVDLKGLSNPKQVLSDLRLLMKPNQVLVLTAIGTVQAADLERLRFLRLARPVAIKDVVDAAAAAIRAGRPLSESLRR
jgi:ActR/RegA family two-component response regulator